MSKDLKSLLENAQTAVLREINTKAGFLQKLLGAGVDKSTLGEAQSAIAKAINQIDKSENKEPTAKLQTHLNEKSNRIKELEKTLERQREELEISNEKAKALEVELQKAKNAAAQIVATPVVATINNDELNRLNERCSNLERQREELERKFSASQEELQGAWDLGLEFNKRLKKLKSEILAQ